MKLLVTLGGQSHQNGEYSYTVAGLVLIDWETKSVLQELTYVSPPEQAAPAGHMHFTYGHLMGRQLLVPTATELLFIDLNEWKIERTLSLPQFNDLHHALVIGDHLYVCNTGLQAVQKLSADGVLLETYSADERPTWEAYDRTRDYRGIHTKPHSVHPNYVFQLDGRLWATRFRRMDAVQLDDPSRRLNVEVGNPHDGIATKGLVYFTTTNGHVVGVDPDSGERARVLDLNGVEPGRGQLGWCRGLRLLDEHTALVGFTAFRPSKWKDAVHWILQDGKQRLPSRIALYDLRASRLLEEMPLPGKWADAAIYSIFCLPD